MATESTEDVGHCFTYLNSLSWKHFLILSVSSFMPLFWVLYWLCSFASLHLFITYTKITVIFLVTLCSLMQVVHHTPWTLLQPKIGLSTAHHSAPIILVVTAERNIILYLGIYLRCLCHAVNPITRATAALHSSRSSVCCFVITQTFEKYWLIVIKQNLAAILLHRQTTTHG